MKVFLIVAAPEEDSVLQLDQVWALDAASRSVSWQEVRRESSCEDPMQLTLRIRRVASTTERASRAASMLHACASHGGGMQPRCSFTCLCCSIFGVETYADLPMGNCGRPCVADAIGRGLVDLPFLMWLSCVGTAS